jgi:hypothetical protein
MALEFAGVFSIMADVQNYDDLADKTQDELFVELGRRLPAGDFEGATPPRPGELMRRAKEWFLDQEKIIAKIICEAPLVVQYRKVAREPANIFVILTEILVEKFAGLEAFIAMIVIKIGIERFCTRCGH